MSGFGSRFLGFGIKFRGSGIIFRVSDFGFGCRASGFGCRVSRFTVSGGGSTCRCLPQLLQIFSLPLSHATDPLPLRTSPSLTPSRRIPEPRAPCRPRIRPRAATVMIWRTGLAPWGMHHARSCCLIVLARRPVSRSVSRSVSRPVSRGMHSAPSLHKDDRAFSPPGVGPLDADEARGGVDGVDVCAALVDRPRAGAQRPLPAKLCRGTSLVRNTHPHRITTGP